MKKKGSLLVVLPIFAGLTLAGMFANGIFTELFKQMGLSVVVAVAVATVLVLISMITAASTISKSKPDSLILIPLWIASQWLVVIPLVIMQTLMTPLGEGSFLGIPNVIWFFAPGVLAVILTLVSIFLNAIHFRQAWPLVMSVILLFVVPTAMAGDGPDSTILLAGMLYFIIPTLIVTMVIVGFLRRR